MLIKQSIARWAAALAVLALAPATADAYKVYFDNSSTAWTSPRVHYWGGTSATEWPGVEMTPYTDNPALTNIWVYDVDDGTTGLVFNAGKGQPQTEDYTTTSPASWADHVFIPVIKDSGGDVSAADRGLIGSYTQGGDNPDPDPDPVNPGGQEYWLEPAMPTQNDAVTLYFDRTKGDGNLKSTDEIWVYTGVKVDGEAEWQHVPSAWSNLADKYKMTHVSGDIYKIEFTPSIAAWYGVDDDEAVTQLAVIFRDKSGDKKQDGGTDSGNHYIDIKKTPINPSASPLGAFQSAESDGRTVIITAAKGRLVITPYAPEVVKIFTLPSSNLSAQERKSISVALKADELNVPFSVSEDDDYYNVNIDGGATVSVDKRSCLVSFYDRQGNLKLAEDRGLVNSNNSHTVSFQAMGDAGFYGGGYNGKWTNVGGHSLLMDNLQTGGWPDQWGTDNHNICISFYVSTSGYGVYFDDHWKGGVMTPSASGSTYKSSALTPIAYYYVGGDDMSQVMSNYTLLTGRQELPPYWAMGYLTSKYSFATASEATNAITATRGLNIPLDGIVFDIHWQGGPDHMGHLDWDSGRYGDGAALIKGFKDTYNVNSVAITEPFFNNGNSARSNYSYLSSHGYLADHSVSNMSWVGNQVGLIDVTNPDAMNWFADTYVPHTRAGMAGWWLDLGEPEQHDTDGHHMGGTFDQVHNEYGNIWIEGVYNKLRSEFPEMRHMLMPRAGAAGMQRFATFPWTGDIMRSWNGLAAQVPALVNASMSGVGYLGSDIGGFRSQGTNANLYLRWVQLGVFYPMMRTHSQDSPEVFNGAYTSVVSDVRKFIRMRYSYLPYTYTMSYANATTGAPMARPANFADADKSVLANCLDAYLWGDNIYVAPVLNSGTQRRITFPDGRWLDLNDGTSIYDGHRTYSYRADMGVLPHFMRQGSVVPRYDASTCMNTAELDRSRVTLECFVDHDADIAASGRLYEDDGTSATTLKRGDYTVTDFSAHVEPGDGIETLRFRLTTSHAPATVSRAASADRRYYVNVYDYKHDGTSTVVVYPFNGSPALGDDPAVSPTFTRVNSLDELQSTSAAYAYYPGSKSTHFKVTLPAGGDYEIKTGKDVVLGAEVIAADTADLALDYGCGVLDYVIGGSVGGDIDIYTPAGICVARYAVGATGGSVAQQAVSLAPGLYMARLSVADRSTTLKFRVD